MKMLLRLLRSEDGPTAVEYAIMIALIVMACFATINAVGQATAESYRSSGNHILNALPER